ncbi:hypothetical protein CMO91_02510, partial [Candidatus Woesearchaeota archaeon]|nr:hypothetical protein [Candidatus Woesearchaeota archaeon]
MRLKFYGIRGSHPTPGPDTVEYGGNTTCFTVDTPEGLKIFDLGSGAVQLGNELVTGQVDADVFLSHQHWDHIQGFPFFKPAYVPGNELRIHGGHQRVERGREQATTIRAKDPGMNYVKGPFMDQQRKDVFPVGLDYLGAEISFTDLEDGQTLGDGTTVTTMYHNQHPGGMFAYRIERNGASIGFTGDYEADKGEEDRRMAEFMRGVDVLIGTHRLLNKKVKYRDLGLLIVDEE